MVSDEALKKLQEQIAAWPMERRFVVQQLIRDYLRNREDLRAYEATGLTPRGVEILKEEKLNSDGMILLGRLMGKKLHEIGCERLHELVEADKEGRTVTVPYCKNCEYGEAYDRMDGKKGIYCHCPRSILRYGNGRIFTPVRENLDFCSYGKPKEG